jgi:hypothetical protein
MTDGVTRLIQTAANRLAMADLAVSTLKAALSRKLLPDGQREQARVVLAAREAERDAAQRALETLKAQPRWALERQLRGEIK